MQLSKIGEFGLIKNIRTKYAEGSPEILAGIGDDAAVIKTTAKKTLITSDMMIEGIHFVLEFTTFYQLGYKFMAINISDILAMGGNPEYFLINLGIPKTYTSRDIDELYSGIQKIAGKFGIALVGGDTCASRQGFVLSGTLIGSVNNIITRSGAREGDGIFVNSTLGDSAAGLQLLKKRKRKVYRFLPATPRLTLLKSHLMPEPSPLKSTSGITSMIDISDGLLMDLSRICDESRAGAVIYENRIPISKELKESAKSLNRDPIEFALKGGEDYALLFTAGPDIKTSAFRIGEIIRNGRFIVNIRGKKSSFKAEGYEHFK